MRTRIIPAQITTVEDRIAGSLNLTQIILLMIPVFLSTVEFIILPPKLHLSIVKIAAALIAAIISLTLALRIKGKVVLSWICILLRYNLRPKYYVYNKNDAYGRDIYLPVTEKRQFRLLKRAKDKKVEKISLKKIVFSDIIRLEQLILSPKYIFSIKTNKKGGLNVGIEQIK